MSPATEKMTLKEIADFLECTEETVIEKAGAGKLAAVKFGRSWIFLRAALMEGLHQTALDNIKPREAAHSKPAPKPLAYAVAIPSRAKASKTVRPTLPDLSSFCDGT